MGEPDDLTAFFDDKRVKRQPLPGALGQIEAHCGYLTAEGFALMFGGQEIYIPRDPGGDHPIARSVGLPLARTIGRLLGPDSFGSATALAVPLGETELKWNIARRLRLSGLSRNEIVRVMRNVYGFSITAARVGTLCRGLPTPTKAGRPPLQTLGGKPRDMEARR